MSIKTPVLWLNFVIGLPALAYSVKLLYTGVPIMMQIDEDRGFLLSSSMLAIGVVALILMMVQLQFSALTVLPFSLSD